MPRTVLLTILVLSGCAPTQAPVANVKTPGVLTVHGAVATRAFEAKWATVKKAQGAQLVEIYDYAAGCADSKPFAQAEAGARRLTLRVANSVWAAGRTLTLPNADVIASIEERGPEGVVETKVTSGELVIVRTWSPGPLHRATEWAQIRIALGSAPNRIEGEADLEQCSGENGLDFGD